MKKMVTVSQLKKTFDQLIKYHQVCKKKEKLHSDLEDRLNYLVISQLVCRRLMKEKTKQLKNIKSFKKEIQKLNDNIKKTKAMLNHVKKELSKLKKTELEMSNNADQMVFDVIFDSIKLDSKISVKNIDEFLSKHEDLVRGAINHRLCNSAKDSFGDL